MKRNHLLLLPVAFMMLTPALAQRYNAGISSGTSGDANTYIGPYAGQYNSQPNNTFLGFAAGQFSGGSGNTYLGYFAGYWNSSIRNTYVGYNAGARQGSSSSNNTFLGWSAGGVNSSGSFNTFIGSSAGSGNSTGGYNTFVGMGSGQRNNGSTNTFVGQATGNFNTTGSDNVFMGYSTGFSNNGSRNTFLGSRSGTSSGSGYDNTFVGYYSGYANTGGVNNTFIGNYAGQGNSTGTSNAFLGFQAGFNNTSGYYNTFLGVYAGRNNGAGVANGFVGYYAGYYTTGSNNNFMGYYSGYGNNTGQNNSFFGHMAGMNNSSGSNNTIVGSSANVSVGTLSNATAIGHRAWVSASNAVILGSINGVNGATAHARVGIGTSSPGYRLHVNASDAAKVGGGSWVVASDKRLKKDIQPFSDGLQVLTQIKPVTFRYNGKAGIETEKQFVGIIAQEMQQIAPYTVGEFVYRDSTGNQETYLDYDANAITYVLINSVQELKAENDALKNTIADMETRIARMERLLSKETGHSSARLDQNQPNPYDKTTLIKYFVPASASGAQLRIVSITGQEVFSRIIDTRGEGEIQLSNTSLPAGTYIYHLIVDGQSVASRKLVVSY